MSGAAERGRAGWTPERRAAQSARATALNSRPGFAKAKGERGRKQLLEAWTDPAFREKMTRHLPALWADPSFRERVAESARHAAFRLNYGVPKGVMCPSWVPKDLQFEFYQIAGLSDEIDACRHLRGLINGG